MSLKYNPSQIEPKWQAVWEKEKIYQAKDFSDKPKQYILVEFPYPSGEGLHVGHCRSYSALDALVRKRRMQGFNVLFPMGWDAFGLPTENFAIKHKVKPQDATKQNTDNFRYQCKRIGFSFDWSREIDTTDPNYYKWTQWIFLKLYENGLAYKKEMPINWCPSCKTGLANEEVVDGNCERCGAKTTKKKLNQWLLRITKYADRLLDDLETVNYLPKIQRQQIEWIGRTEGIIIDYAVINSDKVISCYTTRPDTNFGATFIVLSIDHPDVLDFVTEENKDKVTDYIKKNKDKSERERIAEGRKKTGVFTGFYCLNRLTNQEMPIFVSDFILGAVGTGAAVAVPGHDIRDFEFAQEFNLPVIRVIKGIDNDLSEIDTKAKVVTEGKIVNSEFLNGLSVERAKKKISSYLEEKGWGKCAVNYHLHDWIFSRQHYWGEPIPIIFCQKCGTVPVPYKDLPVTLPDVEHYEPTGTGESPLAKIDGWVNTSCPKCQGPAKRETDTMPNWAGSSWYFLRYIDPHNDNCLADFGKLEYWMPVDIYNGGMEHTTLHLLYSRFWNKFLYDIGMVSVSEPYKRRHSHGVVLGPDEQKMSKSRGNVINPDDIIKSHGADTLRIYEMFMGPFEQAVAWNPRSVNGVFKFLNRIYSLFQRDFDKNGQTDRVLMASLNKLIKKVSGDIEQFKFNTAIAAMMKFVNKLEKSKGLSIKDWDIVLRLLAPFAPHLAEELWQEINYVDNDKSRQENFISIHQQLWPEYDKELLEKEKVTVIIQINGKLRGKLVVEKGKDQKEIEQLALDIDRIKEVIREDEVEKVIFIKDKLINFVI